MGKALLGYVYGPEHEGICGAGFNLISKSLSAFVSPVLDVEMRKPKQLTIRSWMKYISIHCLVCMQD